MCKDKEDPITRLTLEQVSNDGWIATIGTGGDSHFRQQFAFSDTDDLMHFLRMRLAR